MRPAPLPADLARFRRRAQRVVALYGWRDADAEDLVAWMVLEVLEHPARRLAVRYCYQHALEDVWPRHGPSGAKVRETWACLPDVPAPPVVWPEPLVQAALERACQGLRHGPQLLHLALLVHGYGWTQRAIAAQEGCHEARLCQRLTAFVAHVRPRLQALRERPP